MKKKKSKKYYYFIERYYDTYDKHNLYEQIHKGNILKGIKLAWNKHLSEKGEMNKNGR